MKTGEGIMGEKRGAALLLVLGSLVLLGVLLLAFLGGVKGNMKTSKIYADGSSVRTLAESSVNLVMAQISQATAEPDQTWASQPGMIRVYSTGGTSATACYKLYSWDTLKTPGDFNPAANGVPTSWHDQKALFVDLNAPITTGTVRHWPILNPPMTTAISSTITGTMQVEGFEVKSDAPMDRDDPNYNPVPMPVKWLYVLQDGQIVTPTTASSGSVTFSSSDVTPSNPIVGRIAFWTDDETCKVNINTASEGSFWSTPLAEDGYSWYMLAKRQPTQREYQRYPGHPATVSLSTVFGSVLPLTMPTTSGYGSQATFNAIMPKYEQYEPYYWLSPKLNEPGSTGSKAGTIQATGTITVRDDRLYASTEELQFLSNIDPGMSSAPAYSGSRAYSITTGTAIIDEEVLQKAKFFITAHNRSPDVNMFNKPRIITWPVNTGTDKRTLFDRTIAFCGTVSGTGYYFQRERSDSATNDLTAISRNQELLAYLHDLTGRSVPGFGSGNFQTKFGTDNDQILTEIFDYIRCLNLRDHSEDTSTVGNQDSKYEFAKQTSWAASMPRGKSAGAGQVVPIYNASNDTRGFGRFPAIQEIALMFISSAWNNGRAEMVLDDSHKWTGMLKFGAHDVLTINRNDNGTIKSVTHTDFSYVNDDVNYNSANLAMQYAGGPAYSSFSNANITSGTNFYSESRNTLGYDPTIPNQNIAVQAGVFFSFFDPSNGFPGITGSYRVKVSGLSSLRLNGQQLFLDDTLTSIPPSHGGGQYTYTAGGNLGFRSFMAGYKADKGNPNGWYPFLGKEVYVPYTPPTTVSPLQFNGGELTLEIQVPSSSASSYSGAYEVVQTIVIKFDNINAIPIPTYPPRASNNVSRGQWGTRIDIGTDEWSADARFVCDKDVVRSVRAMPGDMRIIAGRKNITVGDNLYGSFPEYSSATDHFAHSLMEAGGFPFYGAILGQLVKGLNYGDASIYDKRHVLKNDDDLIYMVNAGGVANAGSSNTTTTTQTGAYLKYNGAEYLGDWDNGVGYFPDGPYINKADEGVLNKADLTGGKTPYFVELYNLDQLVTPSFFSPNKMMPSPVMFGSLSTGVKRNLPWQTLLFCPNPAAGDNHPGFDSPPDWLLLDLFQMPVVEPYPISEPLSTDGRINMNYQIMPFTYIERSTGVRAVLKQQRIFAVPDSVAGKYKYRYGSQIGENNNQPVYGLNSWPQIDVDNTLGGFEERFDRGDIFRSASEICSLFLYPKFKTADSAPDVPASYNTDAIKRWWQGTEGVADGHKVTGDNGRERPYALIYPLLTTKSNTYMVHMWVQKLQKTPTTAANVWVENQDKVLSEYRGSSVIERYVDPNDSRLEGVDFATQRSATLNNYYKFRVLQSSQFAP
ncbi:MAG: Verru_Chthon cassette protein A [Verrucomicrobiales bacterium]|jgi:uncharacterized protein (TIGR02600 family)|nr:Verru_Chthon cassette protein A [Verrucomicrobiales bacterium]